MSSDPDIVVVGAGIIGSSVAYHVACAGASVALFDAGMPASGVTRDSFAWIGGPGGRDAIDGSTPLRGMALADYRRLEHALPDVRVRWTGSMRWGDDALHDLDALGPDERLLGSAEVAELEPRLRVPPAQAVFTSTDGAVDPVAVTEAFVAGARRHGATLRTGEPVDRLHVENGSVVGVDTLAGPVRTGTVVVAAGVGTSRLTAGIGADLPVEASPALLFGFSAPAHLVRSVVSCPEIEVREASDCHVIAAGDYRGESTTQDLMRSGHDALLRLRATFAGAEDARLLTARLGTRPMPVDGLPVMGRLPDFPSVYVAVMHSAITLAAAAGRLIAAEVVQGLPAEELSGLRPRRFQA